MRKRSLFHRGTWGWLLAALMSAPSSAVGQTYFDKNVTAGALTTFDELVKFNTPSGGEANRKTMVRVITVAPVAGAKFKIVQVPPVPMGKEKTAPETTVPNSASVDVMASGVPVASVLIQPPVPAVPVTAPFAMILITITYDPAFDFMGVSEQWSLQAERGAADRRFLGLVATGIDPPGDPNEVELLTARPKMAPIPSLEFGDVQTNVPDDLMPVLSYVIQNVGTAPLNLAAPPDPSPGPYALFPSPVFAAIPPMGSITVPIRFKPTVLGAASPNTRTMNIASDDPASPTPVTFNGKGVTIDAVLLMDLSGSMVFSLDGMNDTPPEKDSRLWHAKEAGGQLFEAYRQLTGDKGRFGIHAFPDPNRPNPNPDPTKETPTSIEIVPINDAGIVVGQVTQAFGLIGNGGMKAGGWTPMAEGIKSAQGVLNTSTDSYRPTILLLSDGKANVNSTTGPATPDAWIAPLAAKGIRVYSVPYGDPAGLEVDPAQMQRLADGTHGAMLPANPTDFMALKKAFYGGLKQWLGLRDVIDPKSTITASQSKSHDVCIDDQARAVVFTVNWDPLHQQDAVQFSLQSPTGANVTPGTTASVFRTEGGTMWIVKGDLVRRGAGAGLWTLNLRGAQNLAGALNYAYTAQVQSYIDTRPTISGLVGTMSRALATVSLAGISPQLVGRAKVTLQYDRPAESFGTYLATSKVDPALLVLPRTTGGRTDTTPGVVLAAFQPAGQSTTTRVPTTILGEPATFAQRKAWALANVLNQPFGNKRATGTIELFDNGTNGDVKAGDGIYTATGIEAPYDGIYNISLIIDAVATPRQCLQRSTMVSQYVRVGLDPTRLASTVKWQAVEISPFFDIELQRTLGAPPNPGILRQMIVVTPRDEAGNYYGPGHVEDVRFALKEARPIGGAQDRLDGSYAQVVEFASGAAPAVSVSTAGVTSSDVPMSGGLPWWIWIALLILAVALLIVWLIRRKPATP